ncbi:MAG: SDR family oxidoreductase, partial [Candidatus Levyibacteriota bacterium]
MKKVLIIGASGLIGSHVGQFFSKKTTVYKTAIHTKSSSFMPLDISKPNSVNTVIKKIQPTHIFLPAAITLVDYCESHPKETALVNEYGVENILSAMKTLPNPVMLIFFSTNYVFPGRENLYTEKDRPYPINEYGKQKLAAELLIHKSGIKHIIVRTSEVFGWESQQKNFVAKLIYENSLGKKRLVPNDQYGCPTYVDNLVEILNELIDKNCQGIFNIVGKTMLNRYTFAMKIANIFDLNTKLITGVPTSMLPSKTKRPLKVGLSIEKIEQIISTPILSAE